MVFLLTHYTECWHLLPAAKHVPLTITPHHYCTTCRDSRAYPLSICLPVHHSDVVQGYYKWFIRFQFKRILKTNESFIVTLYYNSNSGLFHLRLVIRTRPDATTRQSPPRHTSRSGVSQKGRKQHGCFCRHVPNTAAVISTTTECAGIVGGLGKYPNLSCCFLQRFQGNDRKTLSGVFNPGLSNEI
jgi:hypothetical protein